MHTLIHAYIRTYVHKYIHKYMHTHIHACMHTCIHTYVHTYVHVQHMYYACCSHKVATGLPCGTKDTAPFAISAGLHPGGVTTFPLAGLRWGHFFLESSPSGDETKLNPPNKQLPTTWDVVLFFPSDNWVFEASKSCHRIWFGKGLGLGNPPRTGLKTSSWWRIFCGFSSSYI